MADDREFEPRLGRIRALGSKRGAGYLRRVLRAAALAGGGRTQSSFKGNRIGRGVGAGRVLAQRDRLAAFRSRRVIIKTRLVRVANGGGKAAALHLRYIQRDGVTRDGEPGALYDRASDQADGGRFLGRSAEDRHQFRFIVSAEDAAEYGDLKPFVRRLMTQMEHDLGTDLDWVAVDHHNTGHPHTHIILRGRDDLGKDLIIAREYISHGMRERAAEIVTLDLGPRSDVEIDDQFRGQVEQERLTDLDKALRRQADADGDLRFSDRNHSIDQHHRAGRLQKLARLDLAQEVAPGHWRLRRDMESVLRQMGERADIIRTMHREMTSQGVAHSLDDYVIFDPAAQREAPLIGQVVARGIAHEDRDGHFVVLDGLDGRAHYAEIPETADPAIVPGAIVSLGNDDQKSRRVDLTVAEIASVNNGRYSPALHQRFDPSASPAYITAHVRRLEAMRRQAELVERHADGAWTIPSGHAERGLAFDRSQGRHGESVSLLSPVKLERLIHAEARTWLDQQLTAERPAVKIDQGFGHETREALQRRRQWLLEQDLAKVEAGRVVYSAKMLDELAGRELARAARELAAGLGKPYRPAPMNGPVEGTCREPVQLVSGRFAIVERARDFTLVPWRPVLERSIGKPVTGVARGDSISWTVGRGKGLSPS
jgi:type IV secretory pathway VirD2 relaxase